MDINRLEIVMSSRGFKPYNYEFSDNENCFKLICEHRNANEKIVMDFNNGVLDCYINDKYKSCKAFDIWHCLEIVEKEIYNL